MNSQSESSIWDQRYAEPGFAFGNEPNEFLQMQRHWFSPGQQVLSLGEGEGRNAIWLARQGLTVTAVDLSEVAMQRLSEKAAQWSLPITAIAADLSTWKIQRHSWDAVISIWCHLPSALRCLVHAQVVEGLRPRGVFILEAYTPSQVVRATGGPSNPDLLSSASSLRKELLGLDVLSLSELSRTVSEGNLHNGLSDVVQLVARQPSE